MSPTRPRIAQNERARLDPFEALSGDLAPRDQRDLMERPFFSLAKAKRIAPILYKSGDTEVQVYALPDYGMATIWDADILIWAGSQIVEALDRGLSTSRFFRFTPHQLLTAIGRATGNRDYQLLKNAFARLQSTVVCTTIRHGEHWRRQQFSWINEWEERATRAGRAEGMEFVLPDWFYRGVLDRRLVLTIDPAYFALTGGFERWLYRVARKHAGRQPEGWRFEFRHLHVKSGSQARFSDFAFDLRRLVARQPLPGYSLAIEQDAEARVLLVIRPDSSTVPVDKPWRTSTTIGTSGANHIGTSGARSSGLQAHESQLSLWPRLENGSPNFSNIESNSSSAVQASAGENGTGSTVPEAGGEA